MFQPNEFAKAFALFQLPAVSIDQFASSQRRNFEAATSVTQLTAGSLQVVWQRQWEFLGHLVSRGQEELGQLWMPGTPEQKIAQQAAFAQSAVEKGLTNIREVVDVFVKSGAEATDLVAKRVTETLTEFTTVSVKV